MTTPDMFAGGPLAFPVTPFRHDGELDLDTFRRHVAWLSTFSPPALFVACGTGELASLDDGEVAELVSAAREAASPGVRVIAGAGQGLRFAIRTVQAAEAAGADGLLVLPPYLQVASQDGLLRYYERLAASTRLPIILYQRGTAVFHPDTVLKLAEVDNVIGFKDGLGDIERMQRIVTTVGDRLQYFNGMPTAETFQLAYSGLGVPHYSSAVFNFVPEVSVAFYRALQDADAATLDRLLSDFFVPFSYLRDRVPGYAVSLVKAGVALRWGPVGEVRPPLVEASPEDRRALESLMERVTDLSPR